MDFLKSFVHINATDDIESPIAINTKNMTLHLRYPCKLPYSCSPFYGLLANGIYHIKVCGANGGVKPEEQIEGPKEPDHPHAGGCTSGTIRIIRPTVVYVNVGGHGSKVGNRSERSPGGNNGGARSYYFHTPTSGGGATDIRFEKDDVFHRVLVAGGGGGSDNIDDKYYNNDGMGGSGGGTTAQGWYFNNNQITDFPVANQTFGFTFGNGETSRDGGSNHEFGVHSYTGSDTCGAGGGWFGGFASNDCNQGCGGGSSYVLTQNSPIPEGKIKYHDDEYNLIDEKEYAFSDRRYKFYDEKYERGVWFGNGYAEITFVHQISVIYQSYIYNQHLFIQFLICISK